MPRTSHGRSLLKAAPSRPPKRKLKRDGALNALETAERQNPDTTKIRRHRLGEIEDDSDGPETRADADGRSTKRRKVNEGHDEEEDIDEGSDLEGGTWHTGVNDDDEDSDLDSDEAFGESDEERFADFTFRGSGTTKSRPSRGKPVKARAINLEEDVSDAEDQSVDVDDDDDLGDEAVDLAMAWDMDDADLVDEKAKVATKSSKRNSSKRKNISESEGSDIISSEDDEESQSGDEDSQFSVSEDELEGDTTGLRNFVEGLTAPKSERKTISKPGLGSLPNEPSQYGLPPSKVSAADLLQYVKDPVQRQSLKILQSAERSGPEEYKGGIPGKLSAPLAKRQQDRLDRGAAYDKSKETLNRWIDTVKQNRRAEHLSFPLADHAKESALGQKQLIPTTQSAPVTQLEATINEIMEESGMGPSKGKTVEDHEQAFEELAEKKMDLEEVKARRAELRMARELMFREEVRAKRIKKIKSKAFRRVHRKERGKIEAQQRDALEAAGLLNSDDERDKQDRRRAEERMGARHRESKWAKGVKQAGRATWDDDARAGVTDLAKRDEELRRRIEGKDVANQGSSDLESDSESDYDADTDAEDQRFDQNLESLQAAGPVDTKSRLGQMAFMQRAEASRKAQNDEEIRQLRIAMGNDADALDTHDDEVEKAAGRQKFGARTQTKPVSRQLKPKNDFEARLSEDEAEVDTDDINNERIAPPSNVGTRTESRVTTLSKGVGESKSVPDKSVAKKQQSAKIGAAAVRKSAQKVEAEMDHHTSRSESEDDEHAVMNADETKAALAASIFAGPDDVRREFAKEKAELVEEEGDQVVDNTLPGWGSWAGAGVSKREQKKGKGRFVTTVKGVAPDKRQDARLDKVIINEKRVKKNGKYLATELPHPFETRQQYERSLRLPIGPEWSTVNHYQDAIKPRVLLKQGTVIRPIAKPTA